MNKFVCLYFIIIFAGKNQSYKIQYQIQNDSKRNSKTNNRQSTQ